MMNRIDDDIQKNQHLNDALIALMAVNRDKEINYEVQNKHLNN